MESPPISDRLRARIDSALASDPLALLAALGAVGLSGACQYLAWRHGRFRVGFTWLALLAALPSFAIALRWRAITTERRPFLLGVAALCILAALAPRRATYRPEGDEPFYLAQADLLWRNHDLVAPPEEVRAHSGWYFGTALEPNQVVRIRGQWRISHWPTLGAFYVPAAALQSRWLAQMLVAVLVALGTAAGARGFSRLWGNQDLGILSALALVACSPLGQYGLALFPDGLATAVWMIALDLILSSATWQAGARSGVLASVLVWVKPSYGIIVLALAGIAWLMPERDRTHRVANLAGFGVALAVGVGLFWVFQREVYGSIALGTMPIDLAGAPSQFALSLLEPGRGLVIHYPLFGAILVAALATLAIKPTRRSAAIAVLVVGPAVFAMLLPSMLQTFGALGGWSPPGRYWIPSLPPLIAALALAPEVSRAWLRAALALPAGRATVAALATFGALTNLALCLWPALAFSDGHHWITKLSGG